MPSTSHCLYLAKHLFIKWKIGSEAKTWIFNNKGGIKALHLTNLMDLFTISSFLTIFIMLSQPPLAFSIHSNEHMLYPVRQCSGHTSFLMAKMSLPEAYIMSSQWSEWISAKVTKVAQLATPASYHRCWRKSRSLTQDISSLPTGSRSWCFSLPDS